ncbi:thioester reductase domain-containing protein [Pseudomonas sp. NFR09]|uniref:beta-ketoacyl synthase N-terminal-like domain-containing protein n=1 Tax=Pseudomonas sp. NFR09 TaxID=1566249 RepID=UPI0008CDE73E|nr:beta-ketoacyl synthase N-terminal-like domain-containing protein [Pseudomonas sp. NFR09]SET65056.1 thioester reductase domain-containing protein [Pseudomonas sp. NFR09]
MKKKFLFETAVEPMSPTRDDIAVIGLAVNLPGAQDEALLLELLRGGNDQTRNYPEHRVADVSKFVDYYQSDRSQAAHFFRGAWLDRVDLFDRSPFHMTVAEANLCDPHQRLFLMAAWQALNDAGYGGNALKGTRTAVIACGDTKKGISYLNLVTEQAFDILPLALTGNNASYTPARLSFLLGLHGPASVVDTGCCSSLVGIHQACLGLLSAEYDCAVVGSSELNFMPLDTGLRVGIESSDGSTRSFAADASGTGLGEGAVAVVLKRLQDAQRDGDAIHAVIRGSAVNHSGRSAGLTVPTASGQADAIGEAWRHANITADEIGYIEVHGTGTQLGDPIEFEGLTRAFRRHSPAVQTCAIGTFKSQIGHLMNSAGLAGFVKAVLSVKYGELFPSLHFIAPNPSIDFVGSPYYLNDRLRGWPQGKSAIAGVSSYSMTGTNCHVVVQAPPSRKPVPCEPGEVQLCLQAASPEQLRHYALNLADWLQTQPRVELADVAYTLATGRANQPYRWTIRASEPAEVLRLLRAAANPGSAHEQPGDHKWLVYATVESGQLPKLPTRLSGRRVHLPAPPLNLERHWLDPHSPTLFEANGARGMGQRLRELVEPWLRARAADPEVAHLLEQVEALDLAAVSHFVLTGDIERDQGPLTALVQQTFARKLGLTNVDPQTSITEMGGDSMTVIQIVGALNKYMTVLLNDVYANPTVNDLVRCLLIKRHDEASKPELFARHVLQMDALLEDRTTLETQLQHYYQQRQAAQHALGPLRTDRRSRTVLLTGATGYMGAHFLRVLLDRQDWHVIAPIRAQTPEQGISRLQAAHLHYHARPISAAELERLQVFCADLGEPRLSLSQTDWHDLCEQVDEIIHLAARVRHSGDEARFQHDNVAAVEQIIACAQTGRRKRVHFASSTAVAHGHYDEPPLVRLYTEFDRSLAPAYNNPYSKSKAAAEQLLGQASQAGVDVNIYRFGNVLFHSRTGLFQSNVEENGIYSLIRAFVVLGCYPDSPRRELDFGFIDEMTHAFFAIFDRPALNQGCYHLFNEHCVSVNDICENFAALGYPMKRMPLGEFVRYINTPQVKETHGRIVDRLLFHIGYLTLNLEAVSTLWEIDNSYTRDVLARCGFQWSKVRLAHIDSMVRACPEPNFFPALEHR